ncbi:MAG: beta-galactosidase [Fibrobacter sp.]|nr:beta-galactosidase [Fibrobacter sp.]
MKRISLFAVLAGLAFGLSACGDDNSSASPVVPDDGESGAVVVDELSSSFDVSSSSEGVLPGSSANEPAYSSAGETVDSSAVSSSSAETPVVNVPAESSGSEEVSSSSMIPGDTTAKVTYSLKPFKGPLPNPHKGFTLLTEGAWNFVPEFRFGPDKNGAWNLITYGSGYQRWDKLNPAKGVYDWSELEDLLNVLQEHGLGYALRVFPYSPSYIANNETPSSKYDWTPEWVYKEGAQKDYAIFQDNGVLAQVPRWDDPIYLKAAKDFATALAAKYDGDPRLEYIDVRTFGEWGEWHVSHLDGSDMPSLKVQKELLDHYASVFKKTLLALPSDGYGEIYTYALSLGITKRDDGFIGIPGTADSLVRAYEAGLPTIAENIGSYERMLTFDNKSYMRWTPERWVHEITTAHLTYYVLEQESDCGFRIYNEHKDLADSMTHVIGYNFMVQQAELLTVTGNMETVNTLNITVKNTGIAPCFFDIYMVAEFVDGSGAVLEQLGKTVAVPKGTFKDEMVKEFSFASSVPARQTNVAVLPGVSVALSIYESEDAFKNGKNPTVRFDNDGLQANNKLLLKP